MCDPISLGAIGLAGTGASVVQQIQTGKAQQKHANQVHARNKLLADASAKRNFGALQRQRMEQSELAAEEIRAVTQRARAASASGRATAANAGVAGNTVSTLLDDFERQSLDLEQSKMRVEGFRDTQFGLDAENIRAQQASNQLSTLPGPAQYPSNLSAALTLGAAGANAFNNIFAWDPDAKSWTTKGG